MYRVTPSRPPEAGYSQKCIRIITGPYKCTNVVPRTRLAPVKEAKKEKKMMPLTATAVSPHIIFVSTYYIHILRRLQSRDE